MSIRPDCRSWATSPESKEWRCAICGELVYVCSYCVELLTAELKLLGCIVIRCRHCAPASVDR